MRDMPATAPLSTYNWLASYQTGGSGYDEAVGAKGVVRPHWQDLLSGLAGLSPDECMARAKRLDGRVRDTGIAYDIFADPTKPAQRWQLDLIPIILGSEDWRALESGLIQRARLFDAILSDIYGAQSLLRQGLVPPELVFSDAAYLAPCKGQLPNGGPLKFYAADVARGADGRWRVIDSHTETVAGVGFALANRVVHAQVASDLFKKTNARRLAPYFQNLRDALRQQSGRDNARIGLLTPGPHHEDYFSHAYLARYLGYLLVEGADLRVKGSTVFLKTLEGLKELDLIVRCVDGRASDPLELSFAGFDGPAGLLRVCRETPRLIVNAIGSAVAQNRGLGSYLSALADQLLGEALQIEDAPRLWLGDAKARKQALGHLDDYVVRKAQEGLGRPGRAALGQLPRALSAADRSLLAQEIELHGAQLVAEQRISFSTAPTLRRDGLVPRPFAMRLFVGHTGSGYEVMPGGLAMTVDPDQAVALTAPDGHTRDVWVVAHAEQAPHVSLWRSTLQGARGERSQRVIQSRVADDLFWLGRYAERADWIMRVVRSALRRIAGDNVAEAGRRAAWRCVGALASKNMHPQQRSVPQATDDEIVALCNRLIAGTDDERTLEQTFAGLYRIAQLIRDRLSLEALHSLSRFRPDDGWVKTLSAAEPVAMLDLLDEGLASIAAFNGLMHENMTRNFGWSFLDMGRRLERGYNLSEAIKSLFVPRLETGSEDEVQGLHLLLELADSFITYRSRYRLDPMLPLVLDLLMLDENNPRSLAFQLAALSRHLEGLPDARQGVALSDDRRIALTLLTTIRLADVEKIARDEPNHGLAGIMGQMLAGLPDLSDAVGRHYFNFIDEAPYRLASGITPTS